MKKYTKEVLTTVLNRILTAIFLTALLAALSYLLSSCSGFRAVVDGRSNIYRSDTIHTIYRYDKGINALNVDY